MNIVSLGITAASLVTGLAGAAVAYDLATVDSPETSASAPATPAGDSTRGQAGRDVRWKPCRPPAVREGRACVTEEVRTVQVGAAASVGALPALRRDDIDLDDLFDDHGGDRDDFDHFDDFDDDDHFDDHGGDRDEDDFDDDSSGHGSDHDDDDDDDSSGHGSDHDDDDDDDDWDDRDDDDDDWDDD